MATQELAIDRSKNEITIDLPSPRPRYLKVIISGNNNQIPLLKRRLIKNQNFPTRPSSEAWTEEEVNGGSTELALLGEYHWKHEGKNYSHLIAGHMNSRGGLSCYALCKTKETGPFTALPTPAGWGEDLYVYPEWREGVDWTLPKTKLVKPFRDNVKALMGQHRASPEAKPTMPQLSHELTLAQARQHAMYAASLSLETRDPRFLKLISGIEERISGPALPRQMREDNRFALEKLFTDRLGEWDNNDSHEVEKACKVCPLMLIWKTLVAITNIFPE